MRPSGPAAARVGQLFDQTHGQQLGQALQAAKVSHHADIDFLYAEKTFLRGVAYAGAAHHVQCTANAATLDGSDNRNTQLLDAGKNLLHVPQKL